MIAKDLMSAPVIGIAPDTPVSDVAALLAKHHISGVPVLEQGHVVGIVNEMDMLHRYEIGTEKRASSDPGWWARLFGPDRAPSDYVKSHGVRAQDVMNRTIVSVPEDAPLTTIASLFDARTVRRVCVVRNGELIGMITRADLVRAVAKARSAPEAQPGSDEAIREQLLAELQRQRWWWSDWSSVTVEDGVVTFLGVIRTEDERAAARVAAENVPGVRRVDDHRKRLDELPLGL